MFREMRRKDKETSYQKAIKILEASQYMNIALIGENKYPYIFTANYAILDNKIYIHGAMKGSKIDFLKENDKVCANVVSYCENLPEKLDTAYETAVVFGIAKIIEDISTKIDALEALIKKYSSDYYEQGMQNIENRAKGTCVIEIEIEHITGRQSNLDGKEKYNSV